MAVAEAADSSAPKFQDAAEKAAKTRSAAIASEITSLGDHPWAGRYYAGNGMSANISVDLAPRSGYVFEWQCDIGLLDRNYGDITLKDGTIHLSFAFENHHGGLYEGIAPAFIPVSWGSRRYLIPADDVIGFCNEINGGEEPRMREHGYYLLREGDEKKPVAGWPAIPKEFRACLLSKPVHATITAVGASTLRTIHKDIQFKDTAVTIDAGAGKGLHPGMKLAVTEESVSMTFVRLTHVEAGHSEGVITQDEGDKVVPMKGWRLSTREPWSAAPGDQGK